MPPARELALERRRAPPETVMSPVLVLAALRLTTPVPATVRRPVPERIPERVMVRAAPVAASEVLTVSPVVASVSEMVLTVDQSARAPRVAAPAVKVSAVLLATMPPRPILRRPPVRL